ncbi:putative addiction module component [compost metagenome]
MSITTEQIEQLGRFERLQLAEDLWDRFAAESMPETDSEVLDELERRARWRDEHPSPGKTLAEIAQGLGVRL